MNDCFNFVVQTHVIQSDHDETFAKARALVIGDFCYRSTRVRSSSDLPRANAIAGHRRQA
jgi:hypothetical protein